MDLIWTNWLVLTGVFTVALASPGPDFVMAVRNSVLYSRRAGIWTAIGFALGVGFHVTYCLAGLAVVISKWVLIFNILKYIGAVYLIYVGYKALRSQGFKVDSETSEEYYKLSDWAALRSGFITNLFNPKATMFFLALFTQILDPHVSFAVQLLYGMTCILMTGVWFSVVATVLTAPKIRARFLRASKWIDRTCGALFIALAIKLVAIRL